MTQLTYLAAFDTETTGVNVLEDRIVTASIVYLDAQDNTISEHEWLINPGIPIPDGAAEVHGVTTEHAQEHGVPAPRAIWEIASTVAYFLNNRVPVVAYNASYDFSILNAECERHLGYPLSRFTNGQIPPYIIDPMVIDKKMDRYRKGSRTLTAAASHYDVVLENAHTSVADAIAAAGVARALWENFEVLEEPSFEDLYNEEIVWYAEQQTGLKEYFERQGKEADVNTVWPIRSE
jgi:DNA polymerase-3 subunit epsilon